MEMMEGRSPQAGAGPLLWSSEPCEPAVVTSLVSGYLFTGGKWVKSERGKTGLPPYSSPMPESHLAGWDPSRPIVAAGLNVLFPLPQIDLSPLSCRIQWWPFRHCCTDAWAAPLGFSRLAYVLIYVTYQTKNILEKAGKSKHVQLFSLGFSTPLAQTPILSWKVVRQKDILPTFLTILDCQSFNFIYITTMHSTEASIWSCSLNSFH